jgi:hypothetical protein
MKDKIMNNSFNAGEINHEAFTGEIKIESAVIDMYEDQLGDVIGYRVRSMLDTELYQIFTDSPFHEKYKMPKRIDKTDMVKMFYYFKEHDLPYHPLWEQGYLSVGDVQTTAKWEPGMTEEQTRFFGLKRECGLHEEK